MKESPENASVVQGEQSGQPSPGDSPPQEGPAGFFVRRRPGEELPEPKPVPRWVIVAGECVLFGVPVLLTVLAFGARLPELGLEDPFPALLDLAAVLAVVFGAGAALRAFVLSGHGARLRRAGAGAKRWHAENRNRALWAYLAILGLWVLAFQLPRLSGVSALVFVGTFVFCLATAFALFMAGLMVAAAKDSAPVAQADVRPDVSPDDAAGPGGSETEKGTG